MTEHQLTENQRKYYDICEHLYALRDIAEIYIKKGNEESGIMRVFAMSLEGIIDGLDEVVLHGEKPEEKEAA